MNVITLAAQSRGYVHRCGFGVWAGIRDAVHATLTNGIVAMFIMSIPQTFRSFRFWSINDYAIVVAVCAALMAILGCLPLLFHRRSRGYQYGWTLMQNIGTFFNITLVTIMFVPRQMLLRPLDVAMKQQLFGDTAAAFIITSIIAIIVILSVPVWHILLRAMCRTFTASSHEWCMHPWYALFSVDD